MIRFALAIQLLLAAAAPSPAFAQQMGEVVQARILPGWQKPDGNHMAAVQITLKEGWKTYWRAPGDAGIPPRFNWRGSRNISGVAINWPTPLQMDQGGLKTIGYADAVTLPLTLTPAQPGKAIKLAGRIELGVCRDVCIPVTLKLSQDLPLNQPKPDPRIVAALAERPYNATEAQVGRVACHVSPIKDGLHLRAEVDLPSTGGREMAVIETDSLAIWVAQARTKRQAGRLIAETEMYHVEGRPFALNRAGLRITILGQNHAVDIKGCPGG